MEMIKQISRFRLCYWPFFVCFFFLENGPSMVELNF